MNTEQFKRFLTPKNTGLLLIAVLVLIVVLINFVGTSKKESSKETFAPIAQKSKDCIPLSGTGKQTYEILTDKPNSLQIVQVDVDPIDVDKGETQTITVRVKDDGNNTITKSGGVTANIATDNKNTAAAFTLLRTEDEVAGDGTKSLVSLWEGLWERDDENCTTYMETITATNDKGEETKVDLSFK